jgi:hypothetical protein
MGELTVHSIRDIQEIRIDGDTLKFMRTDSTVVFDTELNRQRTVGQYWTMRIHYPGAYFEDDGVGFWVRCSGCARTVNHQDYYNPVLSQEPRLGPVLDRVYIGLGVSSVSSRDEDLYDAVRALLSDLMPER